MPARILTLGVFLLLVITASMIQAGFEAGEWYFTVMNKPSWMPPEWLFGLAWALVYLLMALAACHVWLTGHFSRLGVLAWWGFLLVLNISWSALFFGLNLIGWAWLLSGLTIAAALLCIRAFHRLSKQSAYLMLPYLVWIVLTWAMNLVLWTMNGGIFGRILL